MREHFLLDPSIIFLNHGSFGACPAPVFQEYQEWQRRLELNPVEFLGRRSGTWLRSARERLSCYLGTTPNNLVFVTNTTAGINAIAKSLPLSSEDEILATDHEYGACVMTWQEVCALKGARYLTSEIPLPFDPNTFVTRIWSNVTPRTRVIFVSHVSAALALRFPVQDLCERARQHNILTVIDGAHAPGQIEVNLEALGADFYVGNCHKWLLSPKGSAFLYARPEVQPLIHGLITSWGYGPEHGDPADHSGYAGRELLERRHQWQGTRDLAAFLATPAALDFRKHYDWETISAEARLLLRETVSQLRDLQKTCSQLSVSDAPWPANEDQDLNMCAVPLPATLWSAHLGKQLFDHYRVEVPVTRHRDRYFLRLSVTPYHSSADLERFVQALVKLARKAESIEAN